MQRWKDLIAILAGRWQIPLALCAVIVAGIALHSLKPPARTVPFDALLADILVLTERGHFLDAANATANLLESRPPLPREQRGVLHQTLAEIIYRQELLRGSPNEHNARLLLEHQEAALACGQRLDSHAALRAAQAREWLGETRAAVEAYRSVLSQSPPAPERQTALQALVRLLEGQPEAAEERRGYIQILLDEPGVPPGYLWWALQHALQDALDQGGIARARDLLTEHGARFQRSDLRGYYDYLWALLHVHAEEMEQAEPLLDRVDQWLADTGSVDPAIDQAGYLPAMTRWLRGCVHLADDRPQVALDWFEQAAALQAHGDMLVKTAVGRARALALLERHEAARAVVVEALRALAGKTPPATVGRQRLRDTLAVLARARHDAGDYDNALAYLALVLELTPPQAGALRLEVLEWFGRENQTAAEAATDRERQQALHAAAGQAYAQAAELARLDERRRAGLLWSGAEQFDRAGLAAEARRVLLQFIEGQSADQRLPQALLRLGQSYAADGQLAEALREYRRLIESYPSLEESWRGRLLMADCLVASGEAHFAEAESILLHILESGQVAPEATVFRDALFALCDLLYQQEQFARAISHMEDFLVFYPADPECRRIRFMLADAYRRSAARLRDAAAAGAEALGRQTGSARLRRAAELFGEYLQSGGEAGEGAPGQDVYERLALFHRGDCLYELDEPEALDEALACYREAAARYQREPAALTAQVQIANVYLRQGKLIEAARAVERARWLLGNIPDQAFAACAEGTDRAFWERYLEALRTSPLFGAAFGPAQ